MSALISKEQAAQLAREVVQAYLEAGEKARLAKGTLAEMAGVSRTRLSQLQKDGNAGLATFLRMTALTARISAGLEEGWLPVSASRGAPQSEAAKRLTK